MDPSLAANSQEAGPPSGSAQMPSDIREQKHIRTSTESREDRESVLSAPLSSTIEMRHELSNAYAKIRDLQWRVDDVGRRAQRDLKKTENEMNSHYQKLLQELERTQENLNQTRRDKKEWELEAIQSKNQLDACQNTLFNLRPADKKTDSQISDDWRKLCARIWNWIDSDSGNKEGPVLSSKRLKDGDYDMKIIGHYWGPDRLELADQYPAILEDLVCYNIHELLYQEMFGEHAELPGLSADEAKMIDSVEQGLKSLKPHRDPSSIDLWKSEAMNAMSVHPSFEDRQGKAAEKIMKKAHSVLAPVLPGLDHAGLVSLHRDVVTVAMTLATDMRLSSKRYHVSFALSPNVQTMSPPSSCLLPAAASKLFRSDLERFHVRDLGSGKTLKSNKPSRDARDEVMGKRILLVEPALWRRRGGAEDVVLQKARVLAKLADVAHGSSGKLTRILSSVMS